MRLTKKKTGGVFLTALASLLGAGGCAKQNTDGRAAGLPPLAPPPASSAPPAPASEPARQAPASSGSLVRVAPEVFAARPVTNPQPPDAETTISGTIVLSEATRARVARGSVMFLTARRADGPPGPASMLAVKKLVADTFPMPFSISEQDAMIPGIPFEGPVTITVRVDQDGDPMTRRKGDAYGKVTDVKVGARKIKLSIDGVQEEDQTLPGGPGAMAAPPGHPM